LLWGKSAQATKAEHNVLGQANAACCADKGDGAVFEEKTLLYP